MLIVSVLLWRPVAAALAWCTEHQAQLSALPVRSGVVGSLLVVHLGVDTWEATSREVVRRDIGRKAYFLPARRRAQDQPWASYGLGMLSSLAHACLAQY
jgi:hypothetical protein